MSTKLPDKDLRPLFAKDDQLHKDLDGFSNTSFSLPLLPVNPARSLTECLVDDISPKKLDPLAPHLWLCSIPTHTTNIPPLHNRTVHGRDSVVSEDPALHLVWTRGRIFVKTLPMYLLSYDFWTQCLLKDNMNGDELRWRQAAMGLLRSYHYCIRHQSDLRIA